MNELGLMTTFSHPNIIRIVGFVEDMQRGDAWIVLPWEENGNVREFLQSGEWDIPERISLVSASAYSALAAVPERTTNLDSRRSKWGSILAYERTSNLSW